MPNHVTNIIYANQKVIDKIKKKDDIYGFIVDFNEVIKCPEELVLKGLGISLNAEDYATSLFRENENENESFLKNIRFHKRIECLNCFDTRTVSMVNSVEELSSVDFDMFIEYIINRHENKISNINLNEESFEQFIQMVKNFKNIGFYNETEFKRKEWGTKWNAYNAFIPKNINEELSQIGFQTAWSTPYNVFIKLSKQFPEEEIKVVFADEDLGSNCGTLVFLNGESIKEDCAPSYSTIKDNRAAMTKWRKFAFEIINPESNPRDYDMNDSYEYIDECDYEEAKDDDLLARGID